MDSIAPRSKSKRGTGRGAGLLHGRAPLQVLFDLCRVLPVEPLGLFVELGVPLVDVVDVCVVVVGPAPAVLGSLIDPTIASKKADWRWPPRRYGHPITVDRDRDPGINVSDWFELCGGGKQTRTRKTRPISQLRVFKALLCVTPWQPCLGLMPHSCVSNTVLSLSQM